jgi:RimJ/RimL family protein N-acetyltransferase
MSANEPTAIRIETDRLVLRPVQAGDAAAIHAGINDYAIVSMLANAPWPYGPEDAEAFVASMEMRDRAREQPLAIEHRREGLIGVTGFHASKDEAFPELGYWVARDHWGQGYASEAASAALIWAQEGWGKRAVRASHFVENRASARVLVKAGMLYTGVVAPLYSKARGEAVPSRKMIWLA